jgi:hypothetical protein
MSRLSTFWAGGALKIWLLALSVTGLCVLIGIGTVYDPDRVIQVYVLAGVAGALLVALRWPHYALAAVLGVGPLEQLVFGRLLKWGVSVGNLAVARLWKEAVLAALLLLLVTGRARGLSRLAILMWAFVALTGVYYALPLGPESAHLAAARQDTGFLLVALVAISLPAPARTYAAVEKVALVAGFVVGLLAYYNQFYPSAWMDFVQQSGIIQYRAAVLAFQTGDILTYARIGNVQFLRSGSVFIDPLVMPYYLLVPLGMVIARAVRGTAGRWHIAVGVVCAAGVMSSLTRSAILAMPVMLAVGYLAVARRRKSSVRMVVGAGLLVPLALTLGLGGQISAGFSGQEPRTAAHLTSLSSSIARVWEHPLGTGLGTAGPIAAANGTEGGLVNDNWYLQVGSEMGMLATLLFVAIVVLALGRLWPLARAGSGVATAALVTLTGLAMGAMVLHTFADLTTAWTTWLMVGLALNPALRAEAVEDESRREERARPAPALAARAAPTS